MDEPIDRHAPIQTVERLPDGAYDIAGRIASPPNLPINYLERFQALTLKPDFADTIFAHIANGGTLINLAAIWGVRHSDISGYLGKNPKLMQEYTVAMMARDEWERERCLQELRAIATVDIRQAYNDDGTLKSVRDMPPELAAALSIVESEELYQGVGEERTLIGYSKKVKFWDKAKAIELFMKKHGLLIERKQVSVTHRLEDIIGAANADIVEAQQVPQESPDPGGVPGVLDSGNPSA